MFMTRWNTSTSISMTNTIATSTIRPSHPALDTLTDTGMSPSLTRITIFRMRIIGTTIERASHPLLYERVGT